jgi:hypothetical protein
MKRDDPCLDHDIRHIVSASGFKVRSNAIAVDVDWTHMVQAVETAEFFLFYINKRTAYFTPKRVIPSSDLAVLRTALRQSIGAKARLWTESVAAV